MHWRETVIKSKNIKWKRVTPKTTEDGKLDFDIHLPLTSLFEHQAKAAFAQGIF